MRTVMNLSTGQEVQFFSSTTPIQAVIAAHAQGRGDLATWDYLDRYGSLVRFGRRVVTCGDWTTLNQ